MKKKYIYDVRMANFYIINGCVCTGTGIHKDTGKTYWCFDFDDNSKKAYDKWVTLCKSRRD